jgi:DNA-directed RNA polymerase subunit M/transcription elongation factor TFIIS
MASLKAIQKLNLIVKDINICENIEKSIYNYASKKCIDKNIEPNISNEIFLRIYVNKLMSLYNNLDKNSYIKNENFYDELMNEKINLDQIAFLSPQEMNKKHWQKYIDKQSAVDEFLYSRSAGIRTQEYKCGRCKEHNCSYYQLQVRCSDEPMTTFINCLNCGNSWSFN